MIQVISQESLNTNQRYAVNWNDGPLLVLACPGSGKTEVLTLRVARILEENEHAGVLALTFTNKAATEMRERVDQLLKINTNRARLCTFHKFASELLCQHGSHIGIRPDHSLLTMKEDRVSVLVEVIRNLQDSRHQIPEDPSHLLHLIDRLFSEAYSGNGDFSTLPSTPPWLEPLFHEYCTALIRANRLDFGSLIYFANRLLRENPKVARVVRIGWTHICVDEFQDTNRAQYELIRLIAPERHHNLFVVADDDQIIYQWNGASVQRVLDLRRHYEVETIQFPHSYRCPPEIINYANLLIKHNSRVLQKEPLVARDQSDGARPQTLRIRHFDSERKEAAFIGEDIQSRGLNPSECVVLGRTRFLLQLITDSLCRNGHNALLIQKKSSFDSPLLGVLVEVLRLANLPHDQVVLERLCHRWYTFSGKMVDSNAVDAQATLVGGNFLRAWMDMVKDQSHSQLLTLIQDNLVDRLDFRKIINWVLDEAKQSLVSQDQEDVTAEEVDIWRSIDNEILQESGTDVTLNNYIHHFDLSSKVPRPSNDTIRCMTIHQAKGLQFRHVYLVGMAQRMFPLYRAVKKGSGSLEMEEERRICFVAITRVQDTLTLSWSREYSGYVKEPSQFLGEMQISSADPRDDPKRIALTRDTHATEMI